MDRRLSKDKMKYEFRKKKLIRLIKMTNKYTTASVTAENITDYVYISTEAHQEDIFSTTLFNLVLDAEF